MSDTTTMTGTPNLNKALSLLQGEMPKVTKTKTAEVKDQQTNRLLYKYDYADLGDVVADMGPLMARHGLAFHCAPMIDPANRGQMILAWSLLHESGEERNGEWPLGPVNQKPQSLGSAITYGRRYCFTAATNVVLEDDDDGQRAQQDHSSRQSAGDLWEQAATSRPQQQQKSQPRTQGPRPVPAQDEHPAEGGSTDWSRWLDGAITLAPNHATLDACTAAWNRSAELVKENKLTREQVAPLHVALRKRMTELRAAGATPGDSNNATAPELGDDWRDKVAGIQGGADGDAVIEEATQLLRDGELGASLLAAIEEAVNTRIAELSGQPVAA